MIRIHALFATAAVLCAVEAPAPALPFGAAESTLLGQVLLDESGCKSCPATFLTTQRYVGFGFTTDSPFGTSLTGRIDVTCADGSTYDVFLLSPRRAGLFQIVPNSCVNFESEKLTLTITSVGLAPPDKNVGVNLGVVGIVR